MSFVVMSQPLNLYCNPTIFLNTISYTSFYNNYPTCYCIITVWYTYIQCSRVNMVKFKFRSFQLVWLVSSSHNPVLCTTKISCLPRNSSLISQIQPVVTLSLSALPAITQLEAWWRRQKLAARIYALLTTSRAKPFLRENVEKITLFHAANK